MATSRTGDKPGKRSPAPIGILLEEARDASAQAGGVAIDRVSWRSAVGERIASRTEPGRLRAGVLTVHAVSAAWAQELTFLSSEILTRVQALGVPAKSLRFIVRPTVAAPTPMRAQPPPVERKPLPRDLAARLQGVADPELRAAIAEAAGEWLARPPLSEAERARDPRAAAARTSRTDPRDRHSPASSRRKP